MERKKVVDYFNSVHTIYLNSSVSLSEVQPMQPSMVLTIKAGFLFLPYMIASLCHYLFIFNSYLYDNSQLYVIFNSQISVIIFFSVLRVRVRVRVIYSVLFMFKSINIKERTSSTTTVSYNMSSCSLQYFVSNHS